MSKKDSYLSGVFYFFKRIWTPVENRAFDIYVHLEKNPVVFPFALFFYGSLFHLYFNVLSQGSDFSLRLLSFSFFLMLFFMIYYRFLIDRNDLEDGGKKLVDNVYEITTFGKKFTWDLRVPYSFAIGSTLFVFSDAVSQDVTRKMLDKGILGVFAFLITPLVTWIFITIRKDIEVGKLREKWCNEMQGDIAFLISRAFSVPDFDEEESEVERGRKEYNRLLSEGRFSEADVMQKRFLEILDKRKKLIYDILDVVWRLDIKLFAIEDESEKVIRNLILDVRRVSIEYLTMIRLRDDGRINGGLVRARPKKSYIEKLDKELVDSITDLHVKSAVFFKYEWQEIKKYDKECKRTIVMIMIVLMYSVFSFLNIVVSALG